MLDKIRKFLEKGGWYTKPKATRHIAGTACILFTFAGIFTWCGIPFDITWPLAGLVAFLFGVFKEFVIDRSNFTSAMSDIALNIIGVLIGLLPWFLA